MSEEQKVAKTSENIENENLQKLREVFPQFVKENTIDFDALQNFFEREGLVAGPEKYGLNWAGKSNAFQAIRTPATGTLVPQMDESKNWDTTENLFIEGDNLEVLKLLQKHYREKIKMIYIDPPYNTGKDFVYKDNFTQGVADYYEQTGQTKNGIKMTANTEKNGRYHSDWLTMMYPRLFLARNLLKDDGVIFISIDDNEVANLRLIMDEIFGEENVECMVWEKVGDGDAGAGRMKITNRFRVDHEYILVGYKNKEKVFLKKKLELPDFKNEYNNPDNDLRGPYKAGNISKTEEKSKESGKNFYEVISPSGKSFIRQWHFTKEEFDDLNGDERIYWGKNGDAVPSIKIFINEPRELVMSSLLRNLGSATSGNKFLEQMFETVVFENPKPINLIRQIIQISTNKNDIFLDFFAGSGTAAHAVMDLNAEDGGNRKWICVQLPEEINEKSEAYKAGYKNIAEISRERIHRAGELIKHKVNKKIDTSAPSENKNTKSVLPLSENIKGLDIGFKSFKLSNSNYRKWNELTNEDDAEEILKQSKLFIEKPLVDNFDEKSVVYEILVKEGFDLNSIIIKVDKSDTDVSFPYYIVGDKTVDGEVARSMMITFVPKLNSKDLENPKVKNCGTFVCFDSALDDTVKVNIMRNVNLKII